MTATKHQEMKIWRTFVGSLPDGYLRDTFAGSENEIEAAILNDVCLPSIEALRRQREDMAVEVKDLAKRRDALKPDVAALERVARRLTRDIEELRTKAEDVARAACTYASHVRDTLKTI